ncbi:site-2 protease family protein [Candidatus Peregrinibacteria bacterium]|nr:site-2 protease family protein [Candidatus Peregrinibacteria bacterium]
MDFSLPELALWILAFAISVSFHEAAHATVANLFGDPTAKYEGRITLNPLKHIDVMGLLFLIFARFGWAKPVPVNPRNFTRPRFHMALVAIAGPLSNFCLAYFFLLFATFSEKSLPPIFTYISSSLFFINVFLGSFNLLPLKPLDGESVLSLFIPRKFREQYEYFAMHGPFLLFGILGLGFFFHVNLLMFILLPIVNYVSTILEFFVFF